MDKVAQSATSSKTSMTLPCKLAGRPTNPLGLTPRGNIHIQTDYAHKHLAKQVPGAKWDWVEK